MAAHLIVLLLFSVLKGVHSITTVSKVSVKAGKSISIPCLYESQYINHVKYLCEGRIWESCRYAVKTNKPDPSGKYLISDDKKQNIFTVTINKLTDKNTDYWCVVEIDNGPDHGKYFQLSVISGTPSLYVDHQRITGYIGESITIRCHHSNSGEMKWCRLGRNCVTGSSGSIDGTTATVYMKNPNIFTVTMSGLRTKDSGWYWCAEGDIQIPVYLTVTEKPITTTTTAASTPTTATGSSTTHTVAGSGTITTVEENKEHRASFDPKILIIPLSVLTLIVIVMLFICFLMRHKQNKAESSATAMAVTKVTYSEIRPKKKHSPKGDREAAEVTYSTLAEMF
ncbi:sentrin-specific protease 5 [Sarotherodon galilaeus]